MENCCLTTYIYIYVCVCVCVCVCACINIYVGVCVDMYIYICSIQDRKHFVNTVTFVHSKLKLVTIVEGD